MKVQYLHEWQVSSSEAIAIQERLVNRVSKKDEFSAVHLIAGIDLSVSRFSKVGRAAVVVLDYPQLRLVESQTVENEIVFPYIPGLLSFREAPLVLKACEKLANTPDLILVDGQGIAHPRRMGLATHLGILLDTPAIGCAKSRLCGEHQPVGNNRGNFSELIHNDEIIGAVLRTKDDVKPLYISIGHRISLPAAIDWVLKCFGGYRLPEPTRLAHLTSQPA